MECKLPESGAEAKADMCELKCDAAPKGECPPPTDTCCMKPKDDADSCCMKAKECCGLPVPPKNSGDGQ